MKGLLLIVLCISLASCNKEKRASEKLMKGGSGNWGQVPMAAHPNVSKEDAILMAKYVLSLKDLK